MASSFSDAAALRLALAELDAGIKNAVKNGGIKEYIQSVKRKVKQLFEAQKLGVFREVFEEFGTFLWNVVIEYNTTRKQNTFNLDAFLQTHRLKLQQLEMADISKDKTAANAKVPAAANVPATAKVPAPAKVPAATKVSAAPFPTKANPDASALKGGFESSFKGAVGSAVSLKSSASKDNITHQKKPMPVKLPEPVERPAPVERPVPVERPAPVKKANPSASRDPALNTSGPATKHVKPLPKSDGLKLTNLEEMVEHLEKTVSDKKSKSKKIKSATAAANADPDLTLAEKYHVLALQAMDQPDSPMHDFQKKKQLSKRANSEDRENWHDSASEWKESETSHHETPANGSKRKRKNSETADPKCKRCIQMDFECKERNCVWKKGGLKACFECWRDKKKCSLRDSEMGEGDVAAGKGKAKPSKNPSKHALLSKAQATKVKSAKYIESSGDEEPSRSPPKKKKKMSDTVQSKGKASEAVNNQTDDDIEFIEVPPKEKIRKVHPDDNIPREGPQTVKKTMPPKTHTQGRKISEIESDDDSDLEINKSVASHNTSVILKNRNPTPVPTFQAAAQIPQDLAGHPFIADLVKRLTAVENKQKSYEEHCADLYAQVEDIKNEVEEIEKSVGHHQVKVWNQDEQINSVERSVAHHKQLADGTSGLLNQTIVMLKSVRKGLAKLQGRMDGVVERLDDVEGRLVDYPNLDSQSEFESGNLGSSHSSESADALDAHPTDVETEADTNDATTNPIGVETDEDADADADTDTEITPEGKINADANSDANDDADADTEITPEGKTNAPAAFPVSGTTSDNTIDTDTSSGTGVVPAAASNTGDNNFLNHSADNNFNDSVESGSNMSLESELSNTSNADKVASKTGVLPDYRSDTSPSPAAPKLDADKDL
ncbi:hypothetical protein JR316_0009096 [Psilocybe cubensis]|uniref:Uncharacterized protein n=2 Tax=Psilocybe cubensis TaxID=181762 RepID=A0ACB8GUE7_PSICU|nr:hypothetical protein JR316_0009096 [Psilocybe cubensis]KAH9478639.1 hypothetical protein JR316_0009096 [Psilocybe cubensis]